MLAIPEVDRVSLAFGNIKHMPKYDTLPAAFQDWHYEPHCEAISYWFYRGAKACPNGIELNGTKYIAKEGVDAAKALAAIKAVMASWEPKHEHKIAACGYMLAEWFEKSAS